MELRRAFTPSQCHAGRAPRATLQMAGCGARSKKASRQMRDAARRTGPPRAVRDTPPPSPLDAFSQNTSISRGACEGAAVGQRRVVRWWCKRCVVQAVRGGCAWPGRGGRAAARAAVARRTAGGSRRPARSLHRCIAALANSR